MASSISIQELEQLAAQLGSVYVPVLLQLIADNAQSEITAIGNLLVEGQLLQARAALEKNMTLEQLEVEKASLNDDLFADATNSAAFLTEIQTVVSGILQALIQFALAAVESLFGV
jgi:hypothetical protein